MAARTITAGQNPVTLINGWNAGDVVSIDAGLYRCSGAISPKANMIIQASDPANPPELCWSKDISGTTNGSWVVSGATWVKTVTGGVPGPTAFTFGGPLGLLYPQMGYKEQVTGASGGAGDGRKPFFKVGVRVSGVLYGSATVAAGQCFIDYDADTVTIGDDPAGRRIEVTQNDTVLSSSNDGVEISHIDLNGGMNRGILVGGTASWNIHDCKVHGFDINIVANNATIVQNCDVHYARNYGMSGNLIGGLISGNEVSWNLVVPLMQADNTPWDSGAWKFTNTKTSTWTLNNVHDNNDFGMWWDVHCETCTITFNTAYNNVTNNLEYEIGYGDTALGNANLAQQTFITDNQLLGGGVGGGFAVKRNLWLAASRNCEVARNTCRGVVTNYQIDLKDETRSQGPFNGVDHRCIGNWVHDNDVWLDQGGTVGVSSEDFADLHGFTQNTWQSNTYHLPSPEGTKFVYQTSTGTAVSAQTSSAWQTKAEPSATFVTVTTGGGASTTATTAALNTLVEYELLVAAVATNATNTFTPPSDMTERADFSTGGSKPASLEVSTGVQVSSQTNVAAKTYTLSASNVWWSLITAFRGEAVTAGDGLGEGPHGTTDPSTVGGGSSGGGAPAAPTITTAPPATLPTDSSGYPPTFVWS